MPDAAALADLRSVEAVDPQNIYICSTYQNAGTYGTELISARWLAVFKTGPQVVDPDNVTYTANPYPNGGIDHWTGVYWIYASEAAKAAGTYPYTVQGVVGPTPVALPSGQCDPNSVITALK